MSGEGTQLMASWQGASTVVLVDAVRSNSSPGCIYRFDASHQPVPSAFFHYSTHAFSVAEAVELSRTLGSLPPRLIIYGIEGQNFAAGTELSPAVAMALSEVSEKIMAEFRDGKARIAAFTQETSHA
jgi:hydrogenase maturation protease